MDILIGGAGVAGPCLAWWLLEGGHTVTIVEKAPAPRSGGYVIDFWGKGYDLAERMGLLPRLLEAGYQVKEVRLDKADGSRAGGFASSVFRRATGGRFTSLPRSELALALTEAVQDRVDLRYGESVADIAQDRTGADVTFESGAAQRFDLVVGAEGIHSRTRDLVFGPEEAFERYLGYQFAAWVIPGYPQRDEDIYVAYGEPGRQVARFSLRDGSTLALLVWRDEAGAAIPHDAAGQRALVRERFAGAKWETPALLATLDAAQDLYVDRVSQIRIDRWRVGRVALVGDAACAPSFLAGQGAALAMIGAYVLAGELGSARGDVKAALSAYEDRLRPFMAAKQRAALGFAGSFVPKTRLGIAFRAFATQFMDIGWVGDMAIGRGITDQVELPEY